MRGGKIDKLSAFLSDNDILTYKIGQFCDQKRLFTLNLHLALFFT